RLQPLHHQPQQFQVQPPYPTQASHNNSRYTTNPPTSRHNNSRHCHFTPNRPATKLHVYNHSIISHNNFRYSHLTPHRPATTIPDTQPIPPPADTTIPGTATLP
ncbi:MAG: hypothetical protein ACK56F_16855, partial [bacterium]